MASSHTTETDLPAQRFPRAQPRQQLTKQRTRTESLISTACCVLTSVAFIVSGTATAINWKLGYDYVGDNQLNSVDFVMLAVAAGALTLGVGTLGIGVTCHMKQRRTHAHQPTRRTD
ncbi:hypothetical protein DFR67_116128 [Williamsia limnetica]|uniref:Uncharacterized protein n=1 Tax=Williamsia limnetica TaxID=882452 RepID=A0A318RGS6_WILLI|nr:hypothetical protein [Williamsia limnetica]PYE13574.1 hypothetical protein DFR67_116128 [Williamsia limnetica]